MKFEEAKAALAVLAGKEAYSIQYAQMTYQVYDTVAEDVKPTCGVYIHGKGWHEAPTWAEALKKMEAEINGATPCDASEAPVDEVVI